MKISLMAFLATWLICGCTTHPTKQPVKTDAPKIPETGIRHDAPTSNTLENYKYTLAQHIAQANSAKIYAGRPQALLRAIIVVKYTVGPNGHLIRSDILRSNHDRASESVALSSLKNTVPFPKPSANLLHNGRVEITESWLFNSDGRFQLRTIAEPQMGE